MKTQNEPRAAGEAAPPYPNFVGPGEKFSIRRTREIPAGFQTTIAGPASYMNLCDVGGFTEKESLRKAAFIVRACNSHAALVAALEETLLAASALYGQFASEWPNHVEDALKRAVTKDGKRVEHYFMDRARAALNSAKSV